MKLILIGVISGIVTGLGMGGGSILILLLTIFMNVEQHTAQATNLMFFIPTAIMAITVHFKEGNVDKKVGKKLLLMTAIGAAIGRLFNHIYNWFKFKKIFWNISTYSTE